MTDPPSPAGSSPATTTPPSARVEAGSGRLSRAVDPRLLRYTRGTRRFLVATVVLGGVTAALVVAQAWLIATTVSASWSTTTG